MAPYLQSILDDAPYLSDRHGHDVKAGPQFTLSPDNRCQMALPVPMARGLHVTSQTVNRATANVSRDRRKIGAQISVAAAGQSTESPCAERDNQHHG